MNNRVEGDRKKNKDKEQDDQDDEEGNRKRDPKAGHC